MDYCYMIFGLNISTGNPVALVYLVVSKTKLTHKEVYQVLEQNGITPHMFGNSDVQNQFSNYKVTQIDQLNNLERTLYRYAMTKKEYIIIQHP